MYFLQWSNLAASSDLTKSIDGPNSEAEAREAEGWKRCRWKA